MKLDVMPILLLSVALTLLMEVLPQQYQKMLSAVHHSSAAGVVWGLLFAQRLHSSVSVKNSKRKPLLLPPCSESVPVKLAESLTAMIRHWTHTVLIRTSRAHKTLAELSGQPI